MISLFVMRHGEAEAFAASDAERALTERGQRDAHRIGAGLAEFAADIPLVCHSPYLRAQQTADCVLQYFPGAQRRVLDALVPMGTPAALAAELDQLGVAQLLCVGHQPLVGNLRNWLVDSSVGAGYPFATASVALLECEYLAPGSARMHWIRSPAEFN